VAYIVLIDHVPPAVPPQGPLDPQM